MRHIYIPNFEIYKTCFTGRLIYERVGKLPIVKVSRWRGDLPLWDYFKMQIYFKIGRKLMFLAEAIDYRIRVSDGLEKDVVWHKDGKKYKAYDTMACEYVPDMTRKTPPTQKVIRKGFIHDTGKTKTATAENG